MPPLPPLVTPLRPYKCQLVLLGFEKNESEKKEIAAVANEDIVSEFSTKGRKLHVLKYSFDSAGASMNIIHLLCYVAGVRTAAFVTVYAQISFLGFFMFSFFVVPKDVLNCEC